MSIVFLFAWLAMLCAVLWYCAVYALPVFVGISVGWWALNHGAGPACVMVGLAAGASTFLIGRLVIASEHLFFRWIALVAFVAPAGYTALFIANDMGGVVSAPWRYLLASIGSVAIGASTFFSLTKPIQFE